MMKRRTYVVLMFGMFVAGIFIPWPSQVFSAEMSAYDIMKRSEVLLDQSRDSQAEMVMSLLNNKGQKRERKLTTFTKKTGKGESKTILFFDSPADVKGTSFLIWSGEDKKDTQWLYLPGLQRVRQISSSSKGDSFMGTELTFYDMGKHNIGDYTYTLLREEPVDGEMCYVILSQPKKPVYYSKVVIWVRKSNFIPARSDFFDLKGEYEKQGIYTNIKTIQGIITPTRTEVRNVKSGRATVIDISNVQYDRGLKDDIFTVRYMKRGN